MAVNFILNFFLRHIVCIHVFDSIKDLLLADVSWSGRHFDHVGRLDIRQLPPVLLSRWDRAQLNMIRGILISY